MKILWITNSLAFPDICNALNIPEPQLGGWMKSMLISISSMYPDLQFGIATLYTGTKQLIKRDIKNVTYYCIPGNLSKQSVMLQSLFVCPSAVKPLDLKKSDIFDIYHIAMYYINRMNF